MALNYNSKKILISPNGIDKNENVIVMENLNKLLNYIRKN